MQSGISRKSNDLGIRRFDIIVDLVREDFFFFCFWDFKQVFKYLVLVFNLQNEVSVYCIFLQIYLKMKQ